MQETLVVDGRERRMLVVAPERGASPRELWLVLHGSHQTGRGIRRFSGEDVDRLAAVGRAVVVYPDAYRHLWNDARAGLVAPSRREGVDDLAFLAAILDRFEVPREPAERRGRDGLARVVVVGFSNGGQLAIRLVHERPGLVDAVALVGATQPEPSNFVAHDAGGAVPMLIVHGTADPIVPFAGGEATPFGVRSRGPGLSAPATARWFARRAGIHAEPAERTLPHRDPSDPTSATVQDFTAPGCPPVRFVAVEGGGHTVPNRARVAPAGVGHGSGDLAIADAMVELVDGSDGLG